VSQVDLARIPGTIIAINDSAIHLPRFDIVVSMDRLWTEYRWPELRELQQAGADPPRGAEEHPDKWPWLARSSAITPRRVLRSAGVLNGTNSGCAASIWPIRCAETDPAVRLRHEARAETASRTGFLIIRGRRSGATTSASTANGRDSSKARSDRVTLPASMWLWSATARSSAFRN
jgi:hypothetical protein